jgi:DNA-binding winged helix-turn-helix (wHTH) protein
LIFLTTGASFPPEERKIATSPLALGSNRMRLTFDDYVLDVACRELLRGSEPIAVEPQVFDLLVYLAQNPDRVVSKDELLQAVWDGRVVSESAINNRVNAARRAIGDSGEAQHLILTVPRKGFRFIGAVKELGADVTKPAVSLHSARGRGILRGLFVATASAFLTVAITAFLRWPGQAHYRRCQPEWSPARRRSRHRAAICACRSRCFP